MKKKITRRVVSKPTKVKFFDMSGEPIFFKARETILLEDLKTKDLIKWLRRNNFKYLAKALSRVINN